MKLQLLLVGAVLFSLCGANASPAHDPSSSRGQGTRGDAVRTPSGARRARLDIAICLDSTGSMGDEIEVVKTRLREMVSRIASGSPRPDVRFGIVTYRDRGDEYITKKWDFSRDVDATREHLATIVAAGGGDGPESVNEALHVAIEELSWDTSPGVERMVFLIGDAPPHFYPDDYSWREEIKAALTRRISINTIGCSGIDDYGGDEGGSAKAIWQEIARRTEGRFDYLAYFEPQSKGADSPAILTEGRQKYQVSPAFRDRWREGGARLVALGGAKLLGSAGTTSGENNLDYVLARDAQTAAQRFGTNYGVAVAHPIQGDTISRGGDSAKRQNTARVIRTSDEWRAFWQTHAPETPLPKVDFSRSVVIAVVQNGASVVEITGAQRIGNQMLVSYRTSEKTRAGIGSAFHIVTLPRSVPDVRVAKLD